MVKVQYEVMYHKKTKVIMGVTLPDGTVLLNDVGNGLRIGYPKSKFVWFFFKQLFRRGKYLEVLFTNTELAILKKIQQMEKVKK